MSLERSQAQMDRERLRRELESVRALCSEHTGVCEDVIGELRGCEQELNVAHRINGELQHRLRQVEGERARLEEAHMGAIQLLRQQVETRTISPYTGPRGSLHLLVTMEDVQDIAFGLSEGWVKTLDMYQLKVDEMEQAIQEDQACMCDLQREKVAYAAQLESMRGHVERQRQEQSRLEQQLVSMQEKFHIECEQYQMVICELQRERELMAQSLEKKMSEHQQLLQLRMDLSLELAAYRSH
uniref:IF rod domain-containing protein n=1 Tax=Knipowitschia caucasica TaxID=637954 RepID=A0AAV2KUI8_KNICA